MHACFTTLKLAATTNKGLGCNIMSCVLKFHQQCRDIRMALRTGLQTLGIKAFILSDCSQVSDVLHMLT